MPDDGLRVMLPARKDQVLMKDGSVHACVAHPTYRPLAMIGTPRYYCVDCNTVFVQDGDVFRESHKFNTPDTKLKKCSPWDDEGRTTCIYVAKMETLVNELERRLIDEIEYHDHDCPNWRSGKKHGPCKCGSRERAIATVSAIRKEILK